MIQDSAKKCSTSSTEYKQKSLSAYRLRSKYAVMWSIDIFLYKVFSICEVKNCEISAYMAYMAQQLK